MAEKYILRVTAGPSYDPSTHSEVAVNGSKATQVKGEQCTASIKVRIQNYRGLPRGSPATSTYFSSPPHEHDQYSIAFRMVPHRSVSAADLLFGNDFDRPIRDKLPPGFGMALGIVKRFIDPGLEGDAYADVPYLYGPLLSSINVLRVGGNIGGGDDKKGYGIPSENGDGDHGIEEGADGDDGQAARHAAELPDDAAARKKWALTPANLDKFVWEQGRLYGGDFFNPYIDFNDFSLKLPGFSLNVLGLLDGSDSLRRSHDLRYTLKDKKTGQVFFVVVFSLLRTEDVEKDEAGSKAQGASVNDDDVD